MASHYVTRAKSLRRCLPSCVRLSLYPWKNLQHPQLGTQMKLRYYSEESAFSAALYTAFAVCDELTNVSESFDRRNTTLKFSLLHNYALLPSPDVFAGRVVHHTILSPHRKKKIHTKILNFSAGEHSFHSLTVIGVMCWMVRFEHRTAEGSVEAPNRLTTPG